MSKQYDSEGFMSSPLEGAGARPKDSYHPDRKQENIVLNDLQGSGKKSTPVFHQTSI